MGTEMIIVEDDDLVVDLLIGQNFTDHPTVLVISGANYLAFTKLAEVTEMPEALTNKYSVSYLRINESDRNKRLKLSKYDCGEISHEQKDLHQSLLVKYRDRFSFETRELGKTNAAKMSIQCVTDKPIVYRTYKLAISEREIVQAGITDLLKNNMIRESRSLYASPVLLVLKKGRRTQDVCRI